MSVSRIDSQEAQVRAIGTRIAGRGFQYPIDKQDQDVKLLTVQVNET